MRLSKIENIKVKKAIVPVLKELLFSRGKEIYLLLKIVTVKEEFWFTGESGIGDILDRAE